MSAVDLLSLPFLKVYRNTIAEVVTTIVGHGDCSSVHAHHGHTYVFTVFALCGYIFQNKHPGDDVRVPKDSDGELM